MGFVRACGIEPAAPHWDLTLPADALDYARGIVADERPTLLISPCSSHAARNWRAERYAAVADYAAAHAPHARGAGRRPQQRRSATMGAAGSCAAAHVAPLLNQIGKDTLPQLLGLLSRSTVLLSPDSGPAHMATMVGLPVIGLYAATSTARAGPYYSRDWCVDSTTRPRANISANPPRKFPGPPRSSAPASWI